MCGSVKIVGKEMTSSLSGRSQAVASDTFSEVTADVLASGCGVCFRATGGSMNPTIKAGEKITVEPVAPRAVKVGDIILYWNHRGVIAHRVVRIERTPGDDWVFLLRGDAAGACDAPVESGRILGKVLSVEREGCSISLCSRKAKLLWALRSGARHIKRRVCGQASPLAFGHAK